MRKPSFTDTRLRVGGSKIIREVSARDRMPTGMLIRKIQCQLMLSVSQPPSTGPIMGAKITPMPKRPIAWPRFSGGKLSMRMLWDVG